MRLRVLRSLLRLGIDNLHVSAQDTHMETDRCTATATNRIYPARCTRTAGHEGRHTFGNAAGDPLAERAFDTVRCSEGCAFRKGFCQDHEVVLFQPEPSRAP